MTGPDRSPLCSPPTPSSRCSHFSLSPGVSRALPPGPPEPSGRRDGLCVDVGEDEREDPVLELRESRRGDVVKRAGAGDVDCDDLLDPSWPPAHDEDRVAEVDRLLDVVGDEDDRAAVLLPDLSEEPLGTRPGERIER